ncbi:alpha/beta hydrolase [Paraclostridium bifermentans]|nr:alpha/beta hydrolase [Paraclostridium bifermentans]
MAREIASKGYPVVLSKMKFNLAILSPNKAKNILDEYPDINSWVIGRTLIRWGYGF